MGRTDLVDLGALAEILLGLLERHLDDGVRFDRWDGLRCYSLHC